jgi:hypothetical protein
MADKYPIDLGSKPMNEPTLAKSSLSKEKYYPSLHLEWPDDYDFPDSGTMEVTFVKTGETKTTHNGKTRYNVTLEIKSIESVEEGEESDEEESDEPKDKNESTGDRLDKMAKKATEEGDY